MRNYRKKNENDLHMDWPLHTIEYTYELLNDEDAHKEGWYFCQNANCPEKHRRFNKKDMISFDDFFFHSDACAQPFKQQISAFPTL